MHSAADCYWSNETISVYHGDCRDILPHLPEVDLIATDPPYGMSYKSGWHDDHEKIVGDDGSFDVVACLELAVARLKLSRHLYVWGRFDFARLKVSKPVELVWDKHNVSGGNLKHPWGSQHELAYFMVSNGKKACRYRDSELLAGRLRKGSILRSMVHPTKKKTKHHPTEKPVDVMRQMIESSSMMGELVLDPFAGSGSTLVAAALEDRRAIGIEIDEKYCETMVKRLESLDRNQPWLS